MIEKYLKSLIDLIKSFTDCSSLSISTRLQQSNHEKQRFLLILNSMLISMLTLNLMSMLNLNSKSKKRDQYLKSYLHDTNDLIISISRMLFDLLQIQNQKLLSKILNK